MANAVRTVTTHVLPLDKMHDDWESIEALLDRYASCPQPHREIYIQFRDDLGWKNFGPHVNEMFLSKL